MADVQRGPFEPDISVAITLADEGEDGPLQETSFFDAQRDAAEKASENAVAALDKTRARGDIWGKSVLGVGTTLVTALGLNTLVSVFPVNGVWGWVAVGLIIVGFGLASIAVILIGQTVASIGAPVVMRTDPDEIDWAASAGARDKVETIYGRFASLNGTGSLQEYVNEALAIERIKTEMVKLQDGSRLDPTTISGIWSSLNVGIQHKIPYELFRRLVSEMEDSEASRKAVKRAAMIRAEVRATMNAAAVVIARHDVVKNLKSRSTKLTLVAIPMGLIIALLAADFAKSSGEKAAETIERNKACVELAEAALKQGWTVRDDCGEIWPPPSSATTEETIPVNPAQDARSSALTAIADRYKTCIGDPATRTEDRVACDQILELEITVP